ncbi:phosphotransferase [Puerhibacterium sp. TATVAM-FAB25]|uniref:phosphotransferase n=1 Tax=Puerhibacterium sp. TATVAM-FAB25 TaxID=3093699 RepID=UPI00397C995F
MLDVADRVALERLAARLPELLPERPACLTHGDLGAQNVLAAPDGRPALIDPAVSYTWAEVDLAHLWTTAPPTWCGRPWRPSVGRPERARAAAGSASRPLRGRRPCG